MSKTDILKRESWRVMEDDSKDEKSGRDVRKCVKSLRLLSRGRVVARVFAWDTEQGGRGVCS